MDIDRNKFVEEHTVFSRSFLKEVQVKLEYPLFEGGKIGSAVNSFFKTNFNISSGNIEDEAFVPIKIETENKGFVFYFDDTEAKLVVNAMAGYRSFIETVYPNTRPLAEFAKGVAGNFGKLSVRKENIWEIDTKSPEDDLHKGLSFILRPDRMHELPSVTAPEGQKSWGISTETQPDMSDEIDCNIKLHIGFSDNQLRYRVIFDATTKSNVNYDSFCDNLLTLNSAIYTMFLQMVSDNVLKLMLKGV